MINSNKANIDINTLKFLYTRYKAHSIPLVVILVCCVLVIAVILPQFQKIGELKEEAEKAQEKITILKNNFEILSKIDGPSIDSQLKIANTALPLHKDFSGILNAILYSSFETGIAIEKFQLNIGDISEEVKDKLSLIELEIFLRSNLEEANKFIDTISKTLPLSEVEAVEVEEGARVKVAFYYTPLPSVRSREGVPINSLSEKELSLIEKISGFNVVNVDVLPATPSSSTPVSNPF